MTFALGAGTIRINVRIARGRVCAVEVSASRPQGLARLFVGRRPEEAPALAGQLFSLCGFSQSVAARLALLGAAGDAMGVDECRLAAFGLLAERVFETLRAFVIAWPSDAVKAGAAEAGFLREALAASHEILARVRSGQCDDSLFDAPVARLATAARGLGICETDREPAAGSVCAAILGETRRDQIFRRRRADALQGADDAEVIGHLARVQGYEALPYLAGRVAETGAYARFCNGTAADEPHMASRFLARIDDVRLCLEQLRRMAGGENVDLAPLLEGRPTSSAGGCGVVECARGRLYHTAEIGPDGVIGNYRILAPTEWNFHPAGPLVETLLSCRLDVDAGQKAVAQLVALFDPCVAFEINLSEARHA